MANREPRQEIIEQVALAVASGNIVDADLLAAQMIKTFPDNSLSRDEIVGLVIAEVARRHGAAVKVGAGTQASAAAGRLFETQSEP